MHKPENNLREGKDPKALLDKERQPCEIWTRVMGYFRPISEFNQGKKSEFYSRKYFKENKTHKPK